MTASTSTSKSKSKCKSSASAGDAGKNPHRLVTGLLVMNLCAMMYLIQSYSSALKLQAGLLIKQQQDQSRSLLVADNNSHSNDDKLEEGDGSIGWVRPPVVYGLVHMAKTAGSSINGMLAVKYERICGNKGYSYDAVASIHRRKITNPRKNVADSITERQDAHSKAWGPGPWSRNRVPFTHMQERGFDDCDYIALEEGVKQWKPLYEQWPMELHVPCRDPLEHLMSMCNFKKFVKALPEDYAFDCKAKNLRRQLIKCDVALHRIKPQLEQAPNVTLKCFNPMPPQRYVDYMDQFLQPKRIQVPHVHIPSNDPRNKSQECVWNQSQEWKDHLVELMKKYFFYYRYCHECMGSDNELDLPPARDMDAPEATVPPDDVATDS